MSYFVDRSSEVFYLRTFFTAWQKYLGRTINLPKFLPEGTWRIEWPMVSSQYRKRNFHLHNSLWKASFLEQNGLNF